MTSFDVAGALETAVVTIGGGRRPGQIAMAEAVWETLASTGTAALLVQAGTGTGKSLAYAVPAAAHAVQVGEPVVIATATIALQRQLVEHDLPVVATAVGTMLQRAPTFEVLKGRSNYLCRDRLNRAPGVGDEDQAMFEVPTSRLGRQAARLRRWANSTETGDRDDLEFVVDPRVWGAMSVSARECPGAQTCRFGGSCFAESARERARRADVVVTNHAMLAIDLQGDVTVLPDHNSVIIDEAHELVDRITTALTRELSGPVVERAVTRARRFLEPDVIERIEDCAGFLSDVLIAAQPGRLRAVGGELLVALGALRDAGHEALTSLRAAASDSPEDASDRARARALVATFHETAASLLTLDDSAVAWVDVSEGRSAVIRLAPLSVTDLLANELFRTERVVLTSATLAIGGDLSRTAQSVGAPEGSKTIDVGSPFDYAKQAMLYCPTHLPRPGRDGPSEQSLAELAELIQAAGGRTLALFSSWRGVDRAYDFLTEKLAPHPELPILRVERGEAVAARVRDFSESPESTLLGTLSLWQGVDVPGDSCILVAIDRIPFPRPDDPLIAARQEQIDRSGGSGFAAVSVPRASLLLAQGAGRLIRTNQDRGVVAVLDPRLATAPYSSTLVRSLPPFYLTTDRVAVRSALTRLRDACVGR